MILLIVLIVTLIIDIYTFKGIKVLLVNNSHPRFKRAIYNGFWTLSTIMVLLILSGFLFRSSTRNLAVFNWYYYLFGIFIVIYMPKLVFITFHLLEDVTHGIRWVIHNLTTSKSTSATKGVPITRSKFLSQTGIILATVPFYSFIWGMAKGRFDFRVEKIRLAFPNLPAAFDGLKIVQISDIHIGGFHGFEEKVKGAIRMVNDQQPDILFFTGDIVNNFYDELNGWVPILSELKAKYAKYSILGNHDYGNYYHWKTEVDKEDNFKKIQYAEAQIGFKLLKNQSEIFTLNGEKLAIIGVENWGHKPFPQRADYDLASKDVLDIPFKILLSHDPTHWDVKIMGKTDVDLTLSGHTHGMQLGFHIAGKEWSPAKFKYPHWGGLYQEGKQYLYVNRGFGYIGFPGRVGMPPEITVIELRKSEVTKVN
jgi:predicted MPP superfamily phosphohydrolase